jgi:hypothetical protein
LFELDVTHPALDRVRIPDDLLLVRQVIFLLKNTITNPAKWSTGSLLPFGSWTLFSHSKNAALFSKLVQRCSKNRKGNKYAVNSHTVDSTVSQGTVCRDIQIDTAEVEEAA